MEIWLRLIVALAMLRASLSLVSYAGSFLPVPGLGFLYFLQIGVYLAAGCFLLFNSWNDRRAVRLAASFCTVASLFAATSLDDLVRLVPLNIEVFLKILAHLRPDSFLPLLVWLFVTDFPSRPAGQKQERILILATKASWAAGIFLLAANAFLPVLKNTPPVLRAFDSRSVTSAYWAVLYGLILPAFPYALWQCRTTSPGEKRRVRLFITGLTLAVVPISLYVLFASLFPDYWQRGRNSPASRIVFGVVEALILSVPLTTTYSVIVGRVLDVKLIIRKVLQYALARYTIILGTALPFIAALSFLYIYRENTLASFLSGSRPFVFGAVLIAGAVGLVVRERVMKVIDRMFFREQYDCHSILAGLISAARHAENCERLATVVTSEVDTALHVDSIALLTADRASCAFDSFDRRVRPLKKPSVLASLIGGNTEPLDVDLEKPRSALTRLPEEERHWLAEGGFRLLVPIIGSRKNLIGFIALGEKKSELPFSGEDRRFLSDIAASAALALENRFLYASSLPGASASPTAERPPRSEPVGAVEHALATECPRCKLVGGPGETVCRGCGGPLTAAEVPHFLAGKFRFERRIGAGGMGVVYLAADLELERQVAVKILPRMSPELLMRFRREARAMAAVMHPNLALIFGVEYWRGIPMLILEYLAGGTLADRLRRARFSPLEGVDLGIVLAHALERIHAASILHRDIKPSNIGYTSDGTPKLLDFGLARMLDNVRSKLESDSTTTLSEVATATHVTGVVGTLAYLPPEAFRGRAFGVHPDLWALGLVLFEILAGRNPFLQKTPAETMQCIQQGTVPEIEQFVPGCPKPLSAFFSKVLASNSRQRPPTAHEFVTRLEALRSDMEKCSAEQTKNE
jgi:hypothetical protein